ncbi:YlzJ-like family protein [Fictibacillus iocasae]|uniref:YlzJ-like family protein n=1 Tax=Fictibacillus iocasae TaxID=2715437 RepID=A0ABW2NSN1_9BACL
MWYTMMPKELMFPEAEGSEQAVQNIMLYNNIPVLIEKEDHSSYRIVRVLSTDPAHFLLDDCQPGSIIK